MRNALRLAGLFVLAVLISGGSGAIGETQKQAGSDSDTPEWLSHIFDGSASHPGTVSSTKSSGFTRDGRAIPGRLSKDDNTLLDDFSRRGFGYFWDNSNAKTGLTLDRAQVDGRPVPGAASNMASIGATGFGLTALCIGAERGWISKAQARERVRATLRFLLERASNERGWFYHFMDASTGEHMPDSEVSTVDTAFVLAGALTARQYFANDPEIAKLATAIYARVDFPWMLVGQPPMLSHGWRPDTGLLADRWDTYSEHTILDLLAIGSPTHPIPADVWNHWRRDEVKYGKHGYVAGDSPLFIHQFSHAWVDYRGLVDGHGMNYYRNSAEATLAQRDFFIKESKEFPGYSKDIWGLTASDGPGGYMTWGAPPMDDDQRKEIDGTVVPCAPAGSLMFTPNESLAAIKAMKEKYGDKIYGKYGFADAFNPQTGWVNRDVLGIDQGIGLLSAENLRTGDVWRWFMRNPEVRAAMLSVGFRAEH